MDFCSLEYKQKLMSHSLSGHKRERTFLTFFAIIAAFAAMFGAMCLDASWSGVAVLAFCLLGIALWDRPAKFNGFQYIIFAMSALNLLAFFVSGSYDANIFVSNMLIWLALALATAKHFDTDEIKQFLNIFIIAVTVVSIVMTVQNPFYTNNPHTDINLFMFALNTAVLPYFNAPVILIALYRILRRVRLQDCLIFIFNVYSLIYAQTRGAFLGVLIGIPFCLIHYLFASENKKATAFRLSAACFSLLFLFAFFAISNKDSFLRLLNFSYATSSGRNLIWGVGFKMLENNPLYWIFGRGYGYFIDNVNSFGETAHHLKYTGLHNLYMQFLVSSGILVAACSLVLYGHIIYKSRSLLFWAVFAAPCVATLVENGIWPTNWFMILFLYWASRDIADNKRNKHYLKPKKSEEYILNDEAPRDCFDELLINVKTKPYIPKIDFLT